MHGTGKCREKNSSVTRGYFHLLFNQHILVVIAPFEFLEQDCYWTDAHATES